MNTWEYRPVAIVEADDFIDRWDRNGLNFLFYWKAKFPKFKITLFTIPERTSQQMLDLIGMQSGWIQLAVHGFSHESNLECYEWDYEKTTALLDRIEKTSYEGIDSNLHPIYKKIFKAPGWSITPDYNGYPADERNPISKDKQAVYKALKDKDYIIFDRHYNVPARPEGCKIVCIDDNPDIVHMHTWNVPSPDLNGKNGFQDVEEVHGVPWDNNTEFYFVSEGWEKGLFKPCQ